MYVYIYIYISLSLSLCLHTPTHTFVCLESGIAEPPGFPLQVRPPGPPQKETDIAACLGLRVDAFGSVEVRVSTTRFQGG